MLSRFRDRSDRSIEQGAAAAAGPGVTAAAEDDASDCSRLLTRYPTATGRPASLRGKRMSMWPG